MRRLDQGNQQRNPDRAQPRNLQQKLMGKMLSAFPLTARREFPVVSEPRCRVADRVFRRAVAHPPLGSSPTKWLDAVENKLLAAARDRPTSIDRLDSIHHTR
jgi:hypothetical protein